MLDWKSATRPIIALSPMADMTDSPFCLLAKELGAKIVFREMVSSEAVVRDSAKTWGMAEFKECERPIIQQIFGKEPAVMARAAAAIEARYHPDGFDINMGCPVYKIVSDFNGACLMKDPERAVAMVKGVKQAISVPLSVKVRLGWSDKNEILDFIRRLEEAGADLVSVHGRTRAQGYSGQADWEAIGRARACVQIPILANGDIHKPEQVPEALRVTGAAGVLIARGALGNPWFMRQAEEVLGCGRIMSPVDLREKIRVIRRHAELHTSHYGPSGIISFRKHLSWYFKGLANAKQVRERAVRVGTMDELRGMLDDFLATAGLLPDNSAV